MLIRNTRNTHVAALLALLLPVVAIADTVVTVDDFTPIGDDPLPQDFTATPSDGALGTITVSSPAAPTNLPATSSDVSANTYGFSLTGLTLDGVAGYTLTWDLTATASAGDGLLINGGANRTWTVDGNQDGGATDISRIDSGETITMTLSNVSLSGPLHKRVEASIANAITINGTAGVLSGLGTETMVVSFGSGMSFRLDDIDLQFDVLSNILLEGSFETNTVNASDPESPWVVVAATAYDVLTNDGRATDGDNVLAMRGNSSDGSSNGSIYQDFETVAGQWYELSFDYLANATTTDGLSLRATITNDLLGDVLDAAIASVPVSSSPSTFESVWFQGDGGTYRLQIFETSTNSFNRDPFLDNVSIVAVPAPAALPAGLALIGLVATRHRRVS